MVIKKVFPKPTVKQVIFQIRYPNLFYIESKIGDFQQKIMNVFPESNLLYRNQFVYVDMGAETKLEDVAAKVDKQKGQKIWQFKTDKSDKGMTLNVLFDSLDLTSNYHKTYNNSDSQEKFRDTIELVISNFLEIVKVPLITRIGLRYIDECPIVEKTNKVFREWYNSVFPLDRFDLSDATEMDFKTVVKKKDYFLRYAESIKNIEGKYKLILDFDGFATNIDAKNYMAVTDNLHDCISDEYERTLKQPVYDYMNRKED